MTLESIGLSNCNHRLALDLVGEAVRSESHFQPRYRSTEMEKVGQPVQQTTRIRLLPMIRCLQSLSMFRPILLKILFPSICHFEADSLHKHLSGQQSQPEYLLTVTNIGTSESSTSGSKTFCPSASGRPPGPDRSRSLDDEDVTGKTPGFTECEKEKKNAVNFLRWHLKFHLKLRQQH